MANKKIEIIWDTVVEEVIGNKDPKNVTGIKIKKLKLFGIALLMKLLVTVNLKM